MTHFAWNISEMHPKNLFDQIINPDVKVLLVYTYEKKLNQMLMKNSIHKMGE